MGHYSASDFPFKGSIDQLIGVSAATKDRILEKHLAVLNTTAAQFKVLIFIGLNRANSSVELCHEPSADSGSMTCMLAHLEKKGLLLRGCCPEGRRCLRLDLSGAGRKVQEQLPLIALTAMNELVTCLSMEELQTLTHLLIKVLLHVGCPRASLQESWSMPFPPLHLRPQRLTLASAILLAVGCVTSEGLEPNARLQPAGVLQTGRSLDGVALSPAVWPRQDWWTGFGDRQLDQLIGEALQGTPGLQIAKARVCQAAATAQAQDVARQPTLDAKTSYSDIRAPTSMAPVPLGGCYLTIKYLSLGFNYDFDLWGGERAAWEAALSQANAARIDNQAARIGLSASVARAYGDLAHAFTVRDLAEEELKRSQRIAGLSQKRMSARPDGKVQLQQAQTQLATTRQQLSAAEQDIVSARIALAVLLGKGPGRGLKLQRPQPLNPVNLNPPSVLPVELLGRRVDIVAARWRVKAARRNIDSAKTEFYPNLNLGAMAGLAALHTSDVLQAPSRFFQMALAISLPIFNGSRRRTNPAEHDTDYGLIVGQCNKTLVQALGEISDDLGRLRSLEQQVIDQRQARNTARSNFDPTMRRYGEGIGSYLDVLSIQQQLLVAERQLASLESQQVDLSVQLVQALGGGFQPDSRSAALATMKAPAK